MSTGRRSCSINSKRSNELREITMQRDESNVCSGRHDAVGLISGQFFFEVTLCNCCRTCNHFS
jgi:hypothetical protein